MARLPRVSGKETVKALKRLGCVPHHTKGGHHFFTKPEGGPPFSVPVHGNRVLKPKTLTSILKQAGISTEEFNKAL